MPYHSKQLSITPFRLGIFDDEVLLISISKITHKQYNKIFNDIGSCTKAFMSEIISFESKLLLSQMQGYLAISEKSPWHLNNWLIKRCLPDELSTWLFSKAKEDNFLSEERYLEMYTSAAKSKGSKPRWRIRRELIEKGIPRQLLEDFELDDVVSLGIIFKNDRRFKNQPREQIIKRLQSKGFKYIDIVSVLAKNIQ